MILPGFLPILKKICCNRRFYYYNSIFDNSIQQDDSGNTVMFVDYQLYFDPPLDNIDWKDKRYDFYKFAQKGIEFIKKKHDSLFEFFKREQKAA